MSDTADTIARAITLAAGRMAHGSTDVDSVRRQLADALRPFFPAAPPVPTCQHCGDALENYGSVSRPHWVHISTNPRAPIGSAQCVGDHWGEIARPVSGVDTPAQHIEWANRLLLDWSATSRPIAEAALMAEVFHHLGRAAELVKDAGTADIGSEWLAGYKTACEDWRRGRHAHTVDGLVYEHTHAAQEPHQDTREHLETHRSVSDRVTVPEARPEAPRTASEPARQVEEPVRRGILARAARDYRISASALAFMDMDGWWIIPPDTDERFGDYGTSTGPEEL